jgi:hypothetical protein
MGVILFVEARGTDDLRMINLEEITNLFQVFFFV